MFVCTLPGVLWQVAIFLVVVEHEALGLEMGDDGSRDRGRDSGLSAELTS